ncbi:Type 1 glutamine amidotransferase-like domain-containing protein [Microbacterium sp. VKM Ac-2870]|uniref:Type 1 glutamine amidotransferase-like domain-containing protein n=1 Tax=Microbacterium sp. VKM Ac-2870 TaxID=2783825 RepID=UPI00188AC1D1|nr:Type 1 glutamine amidotransferase-like domain-containing protein [Microbacterium sp. VKM Ac-2870]MBF4562507.1 Type 1 glutamine amidotransferase-like domain-containing protein [Microbacterium sp. VKM Ac-2870]
MKLLLTSGGVTNDSIRAALEDLLGKPIADSSALFVPTAQWGQPMCSPESVWRSTSGRWPGGIHSPVELGWRSVGTLELTALPTIDPERWMPWVREADALLVDGGEAVYLAEWIRRSGLADLVPELHDTVWVGISAGSMALTPRVGRAFVDRHPEGTDETLGLVDFSIFPHLDYPGWSGNTTKAAYRWAAEIPGRAYAIDDQSAIRVVGGAVEVISEGTWHLLNA